VHYAAGLTWIANSMHGTLVAEYPRLNLNTRRSSMDEALVSSNHPNEAGIHVADLISPDEDLHGSFDVPPTPSSNDRSNPSHRQNMRTAVPVPVPVPIPVPVSEPEPVSPVNSSRASPAPSQTDLQNHYVGPSSGVSFLLRVQKRLHKVVTLSPRSSIFTFGDTPLPEFDSSFFVLPPKEYARTLIARYFDFAVPTHRFLHRPSLEGYLEELYSHLGVMLDRKGERGKRALLFMVFAQAQEYMPHVSGEDSDCRHDMVCP
jgi:hypothetical protein